MQKVQKQKTCFALKHSTRKCRKYNFCSHKSPFFPEAFLQQKKCKKYIYFCLAIIPMLLSPLFGCATQLIMLSQIIVLDKFRLNLNLVFKNVFFTSHSKTGKGQNFKNQNIKS
jgi:hypothetical protein